MLHTPFIPFIILFNHSIQYNNHADLARLESFTSSLKPNPSVSESAARPHQLFQLLCQVVRLYADSNAALNTAHNLVDFEANEYLNMLDLPGLRMDLYDGDGGADGRQLGVEQWYQDDFELLGNGSSM